MADLKNFYQRALDKGIIDESVGYDAFAQSMTNEADRKSFYKHANDNGMKIGKEDEFFAYLDAHMQPEQPAEQAAPEPKNPTVAEHAAPTTDAMGNVQPAKEPQWTLSPEATLAQPVARTPHQQFQQTLQTEKAYQEKQPMFKEQWENNDKPKLDAAWNEALAKAGEAAGNVLDSTPASVALPSTMGGGFGNIGYTMMAERAASKYKDPAKVMDAFSQSLDADYQAKLAEATKSKNPLVMNMDSRDMSDAELSKKYQDAGIMSPEDYQMYKRYVQGQMQDYFVGMNVPQDKMDYFARKFIQGNLLAQLASLYTQSPSQRAYSMQGTAKYEQEHDDFGTKATAFGADVANIVADPLMWIMPGVGEAASKAAIGGIVGRQLGKLGVVDAAGTAQRLMLQKGALKTAQRLTSGAIMMGGIDTGHNIVDQMYQNGNVEFGQVLSSAAKGAATGVLFGSVGRFSEGVQHKIGQMWNKTAGMVAGKSSHFLGGTSVMVGTSAMAQVMQGTPVSDIDWGKEWMHAAAMQLFFDVQGGLKHYSANRSVRMPDGTTRNVPIPDALKRTWEQLKADPYANNFTKEEIEQFNAAGIQGKDAYTIIKNLNGGKDFTWLGEYEKVMDEISANENIDTQAKYKLASLLYGQVNANVHPIYVGDIIVDDQGNCIVRTYDNGGMTYETRKFNSIIEAEEYQERQNEATRNNLKDWQESVIKTQDFAQKLEGVTDDAIEKTIQNYPQLNAEDARRILTADPNELTSIERAIRKQMDTYLTKDVKGVDILSDVRKQVMDDYDMTEKELNDILNEDYSKLSNVEKHIFEDYLTRLNEHMPKSKKATNDMRAINGAEPTDAEQPTNNRDVVRQEVAAEVEPNTHKDGNVYPVKAAGEKGKSGYIVSGEVSVDVDNEGNYHLTSNDVLTVRFEDGSVQQMSARDLNALSGPTSANDAIEAMTDERIAALTADRIESGEKPLMFLDSQGELRGFFPKETAGEVEDEEGNTYTIDQLMQEGMQPVQMDDQGGMRKMSNEEIRRLIDGGDGPQEPPMGGAFAYQKPKEEPKPNVQVIKPNIVDMDDVRYGESMVEYMGDKSAAVGYLNAERDKAQAEVTRLARQQVTRFDGMEDYKRQWDALKAQRIAAQERYNKLQNAITAANNYKTPEERAAEEARKAAMMAKREERKQTKAGIADNTSDGWFTEPNVIIGRSATITLADGKTYKGHYEIVPQSIILPSHNPFDNFKSTKGYPMVEGENINQRDYTSPEEVEKVNQIAQNYGGQAVRYVPSVVKQEMVGEDGKKKVKYIVMDGSGRMSAGHLAAANNTDAAYLQELHNNKGKFVPDAITDEQISKVDAHPRGIFVFDEDIPLTTSMQALFNAQETQRQSNTAAAAAYTRALTPQAVSEIINAIQPFENIDQFFSSNVATNGLVNKLIETGVMSQRDRASLFNGEKINDTGKDTLKNVMLGTVLDPEVIKLLGDEEGLKASILRAIPQIIDNKSLNEYALTEDINNAIRALYDMRNKGLSYTEYTLQLDLETGKPASADYRPFALWLAKAMNEGGVNDFRNKLSNYNNQARLLQGGQIDIFSGKVLDLTELKNQILEENGIEEKEQAAVAEQLGTNVAGGATSDTQVQPVAQDNGQVEQPQVENRLQNAIIAARNGDIAAQDELSKLGIEWGTAGVYRYVNQGEVDFLRNGGRVMGRSNDGRVDVTANGEEPTSATSADYQIVFKSNQDLYMGDELEGNRSSMKNSDLKDGWLSGGYSMDDVERINRRNEDGSYTPIYDAEQGGWLSNEQQVGQQAADEAFEEYKQLKGDGDLSKRTDAELERIIELCDMFTDPYELRDMEETGTGEFISPDIDKQVADVVNTRNVAEEILNERKNAENGSQVTEPATAAPQIIFAKNYYKDNGAREIAHGIKEGNLDSIFEAADDMYAALKPYVNNMVKGGGITLIPIPSRKGKADTTFKLAALISQRITNDNPAWRDGTVSFSDVLEGNERESLYDLKKAGKSIPDGDFFGYRLKGELPAKGTIVLVDGVYATGATMDAAREIVGSDAIPLVYAYDDTASKNAQNAEKNAENDKNILSNEKKAVSLQGNQKEYSADGSSVVVSKDDYKTYLKPEAREVFARLALQRNTKYAHPEVAFIQYAVWDGVVIPLEELKGLEAIKAAQAKIDSYDGELEIDDTQVDTLANRLLDASHGSAVLNEKGKIDLVDGQENFSGEVKRERKAFIIIGRPAAGKSSVFANPLSAEHKARIIDSDIVKPWLDGFDNGDGAGYVQNASVKVANEALWRAAEKGENVIIPKIGGASIVDEITIPLKAAGYTVELLYNEVVPDSSYMRAMARFAESGRYLSLSYLEGIDGKPTKTFDKYSTKYIGETINELPETKVQDLRGRVEGLLGRLRGSVQPTDVEQGRRGISGADVQALLGEGELGGWRDALVLRIGNQPLFDHYVQKNNDVRIGEQPKLVKEGTNDAKLQETNEPQLSEEQARIAKEYDKIKEKYPMSTLMFRVGDFYELYKEDAEEASKILGITLTHGNIMGAGTPMAGFPFHALDTYLPKLIRAGKRVAICDQLEDPKLSSKLVKRPVSELENQPEEVKENVEIVKEAPKQPESKFKVGDKIVYKGKHNGVITDVHADGTYDFEYPNALGIRVEAVNIPADELQPISAPHPYTMTEWEEDRKWGAKEGQQVSQDIIDHIREQEFNIFDQDGVIQMEAPDEELSNLKGTPIYRTFEQDDKGNWTYVGTRRKKEPKLYNTNKYGEETTEQESADSVAIKDEAEAVVAEAASIGQPERSVEPEGRDGGSSIAETVAGERGDVELTPDEQDDYVTTAQGAIDKIDNALDKVNGQLAVLGYYEADTDDGLAFHESYGYLKSAEAKAVKDCDRLAKQLADDLGITLQSKRKVLAKANIAPAGGDISFHLPLEDGRDLYVHFDINPNRGLYYKPDGIEESYVISDMYWRVENPNASGMSRYGTNHNYGDFYGIYGTKFPTYDELLQDIKRDAKDYLPKVEAATKQERVKKAVEKAQRKKADKTRIPDSQQVLDLFADAVEDVNTAINQEPIKQSNNGDTEVRNDGKRKGRTQKAEPAGQPANEDGALGGSQRQTDEGTQPGGVDQSSEQHRVHDGERSGRTAAQPAAQDVKELPESEWKNTNNYHARSGEALAPTTPKARYDANMAAIRLLKQLQDEGRQATREEKDILAQFSGWGGLGEFFKGEPGTTYYARYGEKSPYEEIAEVLNEDELQAAQLSRNSAYYTPAPVINTLWNIAERLGFRGGNILEGSAGIGNILALMPSDISHRSNIQAVEIDDITAGILAQLYPDAKTYHSGFEKVNIPNNSVDLAITNVPFVTGLHVHDPKESDLSKRFGNIHDFCIAKNVRKLRQGGLGIFITSNGTLDNSKDLRRWLVNEGDADVIGAFRMNRETFGGTSATSDIIVVRKRVNGQKDPRAIDVLDTKVARVAIQEIEGEYQRKGGRYQFVEGVNKEVKLVYNQYFVDHPESMGGVMGFGFEHGDTRFGGTTAGCYVDVNVDQDNNLRNWVANMEKGEMQQVSAPTATGVHEKYEGNLPYGSLVLNSKGEICKVGHGEAIPVDGINALKVKGRTKAEVLRDYNTLKSAVDDALTAQAKDITDDELKPYLKDLNAAYDGFVRKYGSLNGNTSLSFLRNDVQWASIAALENVKETLDANGKKKIEVSKTDVFSKRVVGVQPEPKADNAKDGVILSVQQFGTIRPDKIAEWLGKSAEDVEREIIDSRLGFRDPATGNIQVRHEYLSGNVREKLAYAQEHNENGQYDTNIEELRKVLPIDIPAHLIEFNVGSTWIPQELYQEYLKEKYDVGNLKLSHVGSSWVSNEQSGYGNWSLHNEKNRAEGVYSEKIGKQVYGHELMLAAMNNVPIVVSKVEKHYDGTTETITDKAATAACSDKISQIKDDFVEWARGKMQQNEDLAERVQKIYNDRFNSIVPMLGVDKMFLSPHLPNQNHKYTLYDHQQQAVVRATTQPVMLAHEVGTGKTITLISSAMEMRRLGTAKKPMIVVQNATTAQFVKEAKDLYPNAKILTVSERDRTKEGRQEFYAKIKYNDWDLIIVPQSVFDMIPDSEARMRDFIQEKIEEKMHAIEAAKDAGVDSKVINRMQKELEMLNEDLETNNMSGKRTSKKSADKDAKKEAEQRANAAARAEAMLERRTDDVADFDDMGIDALLIDEAHNYKHLGFATMMTRGVKGVDPSYSKRAAALYLKCQSVYERQGHRNVVFATGTPISNTAAEIWTFMKYLMPKEMLKENDIYYFDDFVHNFGKINEQLEFATNGKFKANNRFAQYGNVPELMRLWLTCADCVLTREVGQVNDKVPDIEGGKAQDIFLPQSPSLIDIMAAVRAKLDEYEHMSGKEKKENSHIPLTMYGIAKRAAIDPRLVSGSAADEPLSKTNKAVEETLRSLKDSEKYNGTVAIFCDSYQNKQTGFNLFNEMKDKLVKGGVPAGKIAIIRSEMTDNAKQKIFDAVREGEIRVIMGSTQTLGTGVNIQTRLHTLIHMDAPDRPMDYTQRNGRIIRQGNMHKVWNIPVRVLRFGVEDSLDVTSYQRLKTKAGFIDSIMNGKSMIDNNLENRVIEDVEEGIFDNPVAMLSGSQFALLKSQAERDLRKWKARKEQHNIDQILIANRLRNNVTSTKREEEYIKTYEHRLDVLGQMIPDGKVTEYNVDGRVARTKEQLREALKAANADIQKEADAIRKNSYATNDEKVVTTPISFNGLQFNIDTHLKRRSTWKDGNYVISVDKNVRYSCPALSIEDMPSQFVGLENIIEHIEDRVLSGASSRDNIADSKAHIERMQQESELMRQREGKKFEHQAELDKAQALVDEYTEKMKAEMAAKEAKYAAQSAKAVDLDNMDAEDDSATDIEENFPTEMPSYVAPREEGETMREYVGRIETDKINEFRNQYQELLDRTQDPTERANIMRYYLGELGANKYTYDVLMTDKEIAEFASVVCRFRADDVRTIIEHVHECKPRAICVENKYIFFLGSGINDLESLREDYVHETQHVEEMYTDCVENVVRNSYPEELAYFLQCIKGHDKYGMEASTKEPAVGFRYLASELVANAIESCYNTPIGDNPIERLRQLGVNNEQILNIIRNEFNRQNENNPSRLYLRTGKYASQRTSTFDGGGVSGTAVANQAEARRSNVATNQGNRKSPKGRLNEEQLAKLRDDVVRRIQLAQVMAFDDPEFSLREKDAPKKTGIGYKVFFRGKDGKLYPPMVANPDGADTPVGVWLDADAAPVVGTTKTGRPQVKAGGKGTQGGSGTLAYRPGWHLGEIPYALQFNRKDEKGNKTLFPKDFVWAEVEYAADVDYQKDANLEGYKGLDGKWSSKYNHALAGLKQVPENGFYRYRTNPNPETDPWIITGAMKVNRVLSNDEVDAIVRAAGREPQRRQGERNERMDIIDAAAKSYMRAPNGKKSKLNAANWTDVRTKNFKRWFGDWENDPANASKVVDKNGEPMVVYHGTPKGDFTEFAEGRDIWTFNKRNLADQYRHSRGSLAVSMFPAKDSRIIDGFMNLRNPYEITVNGAHYRISKQRVENDLYGKDYSYVDKPEWLTADDVVKMVREHGGYDGVIFRDMYDNMFTTDKERGDVIVGFHPNQFKSASHNSGEYSSSLNFNDNFGNEAPLSRHEAVTRGIVEAAKENREYMMQALKAVSSDIKAIRTALNMQAEVDKNVVGSLLNLYMTLTRDASAWTATGGQMPFTSGQIFSQIRNAIGKEDITPYVDKIMDYVVNAQAKAAKMQFDKLRNTPIDKLNISGVVSQGKVAIQGQHALKALNDALAAELTVEQLEDMIADAMDKEDNATDESLRTQYKGRMIGYTIAAQHLERLRQLTQERQQLDDQMKDAAHMDHLSRQARKELAESIRQSIRDNQMEQADAYIQSARDLKEYVETQGERAKQFLDKITANREKIRGYAATDLGSVATNPNRMRTKQGVVRQVWDAIASPIRDLQSLLRMCAPKAINGEGYLYNHFMRGWTDAADTERKGIIDSMQTLDSKIAELTNGKYKTWEEAANEIASASQNDFAVEIKDGAREEEIPLNANNALYIYAVNKMEDGKMKLRAMNITDEDVQKLANSVREKFGQEIIDVVDWIQSDYFKQLRNRYNPTHESLFGAPMDAIDNYFPLVINPNSRQQNEDLGADDNDAAKLLAGTSTGAIKRRTKNQLPLDIRNTDFFQQVIRHISQMEHWNAFAQWNRDANILFSDIAFRNRVKNMDGTIYGKGDALYNYLKDAFKVAMGTYKPKSDNFSQFTLNVAKGVTAAKINFRLFTAVKQLASFPAFFTFMTDGVFVQSYMRNWMKPHETMTWAKETLPNFEKRIHKRDLGDMRLMSRSTDWQWNKRILEWSQRYGMAANVFFDTLTCATGARAVYDSHRVDYINKGYSVEEAENRARQDAEQAFNTSQQSSEGAYLAPIQMDRNVITAALTVFRTSPIQYTRNFIYHTRNIVNKYGNRDEQINFRKNQYINDGLTEEQAQNAAEHDYNKSMRSDIIGMVVYGALLNILWRLAGKVPYLVFGDDDDKKKEILKEAISGGALVSPITGLLGGANIESMLDGYDGVSGIFKPELPFTQDVAKAERLLKQDRYAEYASQALSVLMQSGVGFDPQTAADMIARSVTTLDSEQDLDAAEKALRVTYALFSIPQEQYEQVLVDQVIDNRREYRNALKDYERYQAVHTAPLTWYLRDEETEEKAINAAKTKFDKLIKERKELRKK